MIKIIEALFLTSGTCYNSEHEESAASGFGLSCFVSILIHYLLLYINHSVIYQIQKKKKERKKMWLRKEPHYSNICVRVQNKSTKQDINHELFSLLRVYFIFTWFSIFLFKQNNKKCTKFLGTIVPSTIRWILKKSSNVPINKWYVGLGLCYRHTYIPFSIEINFSSTNTQIQYDNFSARLFDHSHKI